jgi:ATP-dependent Clp protease adaptor protein ClpS
VNLLVDGRTSHAPKPAGKLNFRIMRAMSTTTVEKPRSGGPGSDLGGEWRVIVRNDSHNTFDYVAATLARVLPGVSLDQGHQFAESIHNSGQAIVWSGQRELAEHYWQQLDSAGLTMAPLERA